MSTGSAAEAVLANTALTPTTIEWPRVGIVLNVHARKYSNRIAESVRQMAPEAKLYVTHSIEEAASAIQDMVRNGVDTVLSGGGDGTHVGLLTSWRELVRNKAQEGRETLPQMLPNFGMLRLGTGNGWAISEGIRHKLGLLKSLSQQGKLTIARQPLVEYQGHLFPFGGLGWDGAIINDYDSFKAQVRGWPLGRRIEGVWMYMAAVVTRTIPRELRREKPIEVKISVLGDTDQIVYQDGKPSLQPVGNDENWTTVYEGPNGLNGAATIPFMGYNFRAFPHLEQGLGERHRFEYRIVHYKPLACFARLPRIWSTGYGNSPMITSFFAERVRVEYSEPVAMQLAGEPFGYHTEAEFKLSDDEIPMIRAS